MFTTAKEIAHESLSICVYGESGIGKTTLVRSLVNKYPGEVLIINAENGLLSIADLDVDVYDVTVDSNGKEMERHFRFEKLIHLFKNILNQEEYQKKYKWLVVDSLTEVAQCLVEAMKIKHPSSTDNFKLWGEYNDKITDLVKKIRDFRPYNTLFLALDAIDKDESGRRFIGIDVNGKVSRRIPAIVDEVFYYRKFKKDEQEHRMLVTAPYENAQAKDRSTKLDLIERPDLGAIIDKIIGEKCEVKIEDSSGAS